MEMGDKNIDYYFQTPRITPSRLEFLMEDIEGAELCFMSIYLFEVDFSRTIL